MRCNKPVGISPDIHIPAGSNQSAITVRKQKNKMGKNHKGKKTQQ